jgi:cathepsin B
VKKLLGAWNKDFDPYGVYDPNVNDHIKQVAPEFNVTESPPDSYDARTANPKCTVISTVRDQSSCGSCWAFSATESFESSRCVQKGEDVQFSTMDTAGCCRGLFCGLSMGCGGGQQGSALNWMTRTGVVTGGDYDSNSGCKPYEFAPCAHHVDPTPKYPACPSSEYSTTCKKECESSYTTKSYDNDKTKGSDAFSLRSVSEMQSAIMQYGPLAVSFSVYSDFPTYKSGVYKHTSGSMLGGHAVLMVGWGTDPTGGDYWIIKNSWNEEWGDGGFFKIARGTDECGIESDVSGIKFE